MKQTALAAVLIVIGFIGTHSIIAEATGLAWINEVTKDQLFCMIGLVVLGMPRRMK